MIRHYCDRCKRDCNNNYASFMMPTASDETFREVTLHGLVTIKEFDLCEDCIEELINWRRKYNECNAET